MNISLFGQRVYSHGAGVKMSLSYFCPKCATFQCGEGCRGPVSLISTAEAYKKICFTHDPLQHSILNTAWSCPGW